MKKPILLLLFCLFGLIGQAFAPGTYSKVYIEWIDIIATDSGWHSKSDIDYWIETETDTVKQAGFLYKETKTHIILIDSFISKDYLGAATKIPRGNIIKIQRF